MALNQEAIAAAVKKEIERQQAAVVYEDLSVDELTAVVSQLGAKLDQCKTALAKRSGGGPAMKAEKSTGSFPELPWGREYLPSPPCCFQRAAVGLLGCGGRMREWRQLRFVYRHRRCRCC